MKVISIGAYRTGTTSLGKAFELLGCRVSPESKLLFREWKRNKKRLLWPLLEHFDAFFNVPWAYMYREIYEKYPDSKFIMTQRKDVETCAISQWYKQSFTGKRTKPPPSISQLRKLKKQITHWQNDRLEYFNDKAGSLLVVCWELGDGWKEICRFLNLPIPNLPFPHKNKRDMTPVKPKPVKPKPVKPKPVKPKPVKPKPVKPKPVKPKPVKPKPVKLKPVKPSKAG